MGSSDLRDRLTELLQRPVEALGLDLDDVEITAAGKRSVLRVAVDRDGGVDLDTIADATRSISLALDESNVMGERAYTLEVGSRGVDRPLTLPRHWRRNVTRLVAVTLADGTAVSGRIVEADDDAATIETKVGPQQVRYADVKKAKIQIEFTKGS